MKKLKDYETQLKTCSKCGLCQSVCPVYKATGKETIVSRGKFNLLLGLLKGDLNYTKNMDKALSMCLNCKACNDFCPSSIKTTEILCAAKNEYKNYCFPFKYDSFFKLRMILLSLIFKTYRFFHFSSFVFLFKKIIIKFGFFGEIFLLFDKISKINIKRKKTTNKKNKLKVIYFEGCFTKYLNPSVKNALLNQLEKNGVEVIQKSFDCCGISALYNGKYDLFNKLKEKNSKLLSEDCDYIVCDCASCLSTLKDYKKDFSEKIVDIYELLFKLENKKNNHSVTYHLPCHLREKKEKISKQLIENFVNYKEMKDFDVCCGFSGDFSIKFPKIAEKISEQKIKNITKTNADYVLTSCPGCVIGITKGLIHSKVNKNVLNIVEYLEINS